MPRLALVTCQTLPEPDPDAQLLLDACLAAGFDAQYVAWEDESVDWGAYDLAVVRSTWNYHLHPDEFETWIEETATKTALWNQADTMIYNLHKSYLLDFENVGVPYVHTKLVKEHEPRSVADVIADEDWPLFVIKPAISAASHMTRRFTRDEMPEAEAFLLEILADRDALVQPYIKSVAKGGEVSLIHIDGELTHAVVKTPRFDGQEEAVSEGFQPSPELREIAQRVMRSFPFPTLYARLDVMQADDGFWMVSELELIEPSLFLAQHPPAVEKLVAAMARLGTLSTPL